MGRFGRWFDDFYRTTSSDIYKFCEALNFTPTFQQKMLLDAVAAGHRRIACKSGQGPGKTTVSSVIGLWRTWRRHNALTVITAPTMRQCRDVWLVEARRRLTNAHPVLQKFINITKSKVEIGGDPDWGVRLVTATKEENAQGYHQENMTVICEEASGVPREIITQFKGTLSNADSLFIQIGNPNTRDCAFFDCFNRHRHDWHCITFNAEETPEHIVSQASRLKLAQEFGRDSDVYRVRVLGEFPHTDPNCVMSSDECEQCADQRDIYKQVLANRNKKQFGIDLARFGGDESTVWRRSGNAIVEWKTFNHKEPGHVIDYAFKMQADAEWKDADTVYVVDATGMGQGVMSKLYDAGKRVVEYHNGGKADEPQYENKITQGWFELAKRLKAKQAYIPNDNILIQQLSGRQYFTTAKGKLVLETKDKYLERNENSPDRADGVVMAFYDRGTASAQTSQHEAGSAVGANVRGH